jgi:cell division protein ZapA (FtsZ GTPase activity inhibitor)
VEIRILGQKFRIASDSDEQRVQKLAEFVNVKLEEVRGEAKAMPIQSLLTLGLLNMADEYMRFKEEKLSQMEKVTVKVQRLIEVMEEAG